MGEESQGGDPQSPPDLPADYRGLLERLKTEIGAARARRLATESPFKAEPAATSLDALPSPQSGRIRQPANVPDALDVLGSLDSPAERDPRQAVLDRLPPAILESGRGLAFLGRQVHLDIDGDGFYIDLLFFDVNQLRYVVVEVRAGDVLPEHVGKVTFYLAAVDDLYRKPQHASSVGLLVCAGSSRSEVRYYLASGPTGVAGLTYEELPEAERDLLPDVAGILEAIGEPLKDGRPKFGFDE